MKIAAKIYFFLLGLFLIFALSMPGQEARLKLKVVTEQANIRLKPDIGSIIIHQALKGAILESTGKENEWYQVIIKTIEGESAIGYVHESLVMEVGVPPREREKTPEKREKIEEELPKTQADKPVAAAPSFVAPGGRITLSLSGGRKYFTGGDLNKGSEGLADSYEDDLGITRNGDVKPLHLSYIFGGEINFSLSSKFLVGLGFDYLFGKQESVVKFSKETSSDLFTTRPKVEAYPLRLCLSFFPLPYLYFKSGIEYYFVKSTLYYHFKVEDVFEEWSGDAKAQGIGYLGSLGLVVAPSSRINLFLELGGRYARIDGFEGENVYTDSTGYKSTEKGKLYFYQITSGGKSYPRLFIWEDKPSGTGVTDVREAFINLSGISIKAGIRINF